MNLVKAENKNKSLILIVDDVMENLQLIGNILVEEGYDISMANSGTQALKMVAKISPDLILLDVMIPDINGFDVCKEIKKMDKKKNIPIIFLTVNTDITNIVKGFNFGGVDYITKPFEREELLVRINTHLELKKARETIERQVKELKKSEDLLQKKNKEISDAHQRIKDSITYARSIQSAVLPFETRIKHFLNKYFIMLIPKDIVSGDFYWIEKIDGKIVIVVADCTGHGVPGAFMSMIGNEMLNNIVIKQRIFEPAKVLEEMHKDVRFALKQDRIVASSHDGMDVCLCVIEDDKLTFAGAKRPLYYVQNNNFYEIKGDRKPIGGIQKEKVRTFSNNEIELTTETMLYLTTDGYKDQHNTRQEKFGIKRFLRLLFSIADKPMDEQKKILQKTLRDFSMGEENRDDITVIGVRFF
jgi:sigma-B regulation protein RsbU (phosphoserine phosphatase)